MASDSITSESAGVSSAGTASAGDRTKLVDRWSRLRMGHEAVMLEDAREVLAQNRKQVAAHSEANGLPVSGTGDDVGNTLNLGDTTIYQAPAAPAAASTSPLAKALIAGAIATGVGGPIGAGLALPDILQALKPAAPVVAPEKPVAPQPVPQAADTNTLFDLYIGGPK